ncbi:MAG TPA: hypothetical protein VGM94_03525 [Galbitalea sp.]
MPHAPASGGTTKRRDSDPVTPESLLREGALFLEAAGVHRSVSWLRRTVRKFSASAVGGMPFGMFLAAQLELNSRQTGFLAERADLRYLLSYADPTGETAVRNVMREQRR